MKCDRTDRKQIEAKGTQNNVIIIGDCICDVGDSLEAFWNEETVPDGKRLSESGKHDNLVEITKYGNKT
jgi:ATP-dependent exoDNAse (exonuclease V) alpha subunit